MDGLDERVVTEVVAFFGAAVSDAEVAVVDEIGEDLGEDRPEILVDRIHLEDRHLVLHEQLVHGIHRRNRSDVPGPEHETDPARTVGILAVDDRLRCSQVVGRDAGLHPDLGTYPRPQQLVVHVGGEHADDGLALSGGDRARELRAAVIEDVLQRVPEQAGVAHRQVRAGVPLLGSHRILEGDPFGDAGETHPAFGERGGALDDRVEVRDPLLDRRCRPHGLRCLQSRQVFVDLLARGDRKGVPAFGVNDAACGHVQLLLRLVAPQRSWTSRLRGGPPRTVFARDHCSIGASSRARTGV